MTEIQSVLKESRVFEPKEAFRAGAYPEDPAEFEALYKRSVEDPEGFWTEQAGLSLAEALGQGARVEGPRSRSGSWAARLNLSYNCLDRHLATPGAEQGGHSSGRASRAKRGPLTYASCTARCASWRTCSRAWASQKGDRVGIYLPMIPEVAIAMLACARIGAVHSVVFGGFSAEALRERMNDAEAKVVITADGGCARGRGGAAEGQRRRRARGRLPHGGEGRGRAAHREARAHGTAAATTGGTSSWQASPADCPPESVDSEHPLFILYTSRLHREAQGRAPHHRRLPRCTSRSPPHGSSTCSDDGRLLVHRRRGLGHRAQLRGLRPADERRDRRHVRGRPQPARAGPLLGDHRRATGSPSSTPRRPPSAPSCGWGEHGRASTTSSQPAPAGHGG